MIVSQGEFLQINEINTHFRADGKGKCIIFVHGFLVCSIVWKNLWEEIQQLSTFHLIAPDLPGSGLSSRNLNFTYTFDEFSKWLSLFIKNVSKDPVVLVGHSLGGGISALTAANYPQLIEKLILIDPVTFPQKLPLKGKIPLIPKVGEFVFRYLYNKTLFRDYMKKNVYHPDYKMNEEMIDDFYFLFSTPETRKVNYKILKELNNPIIVSNSLNKIVSPVLLLWGDSDKLFPPDELIPKINKVIPDAISVVISNCGHSPPEEKPAITAKEIVNFINS